MDNNEIYKRIKQNIELLINDKRFDEAKSLIDEYKKIKPDDIEIYSMEGIIFMTQGKLNEAEEILKHGLDIDSCNFDLNYNLAYVYGEQKKYDDSLKYYEQALKNCSDENMKKEIEVVISKFENEHGAKVRTSKVRIVFFDKGDDKFIWDIINELSKEYETKHIRVTNYNQIDEGMQWADICWFEWCDELVIYGSKLPIAKEKKIICRIHGYEVYTDLIRQPNWNNIDDLIIVAPHIRRIFEENTSNINLKGLRVHTIFCGINVGRYPLNIKKKGFNLGYLGYINFKKNIPLTFDIFKKLYDIDDRYKLYIAGQFQDVRTLSYLGYFIKEYKLEKSIIFDGWQDEERKIKWFKKIDYMVISSIDEGLCFAAAEGMASGVKPILHNCEGLKDHYDKKYIFNNIDEAVKMITENGYNSEEYRAFIENNYSLKKQLIAIKNLLNDLLEESLTNINDSNSANIYDFNYNGMNIKFYLPYLNDWIQNIIYNSRNFYEIGMLEDIRKRIGRNKTIIDVGANIGNHTIYFSKICNAKKVISFEPQKNIFSILKKNVELNNCSKNVKLYNMGIGEQYQHADVEVIDINNYGSSRLKKDSDGSVEINTLDNMAYNKFGKIDMLKIDVEGMELEVLKGSINILKKYKPLIYVEAASNVEFENASKFLKKYNYSPVYRFNATPTYLFLVPDITRKM